MIQPVWRGPAPSIYSGVENPILDELIAWRPAEPGQWWYRWGADWPALGDHFIDDAHINGKPLNCHLTPLDWLRGGCRGCVMLGIAEGFAIERGHVPIEFEQVVAGAHVVEQVTI